MNFARMMLLLALSTVATGTSAQEVASVDLKMPERQARITEAKPSAKTSARDNQRGEDLSEHASCSTVWHVHGDGEIVPAPAALELVDLEVSAANWPKLAGSVRLLNVSSQDIEVPWCAYGQVEEIKTKSEYSYEAAGLSLWIERKGKLGEPIIAGGSLATIDGRPQCRAHLRPGQWMTLRFEGEAACSSDHKACLTFEDAFRTRVIARWVEAQHSRKFSGCTDATNFYKARDIASDPVPLKMR